MKLHVHVDDDGKSISPALAPKAVAGSDQRTGTLPESPSAKKSTPFSNGVANCVDIVYIAIATIFYGMLQIWGSKNGYGNGYKFMFWVWVYCFVMLIKKKMIVLFGL